MIKFCFRYIYLVFYYSVIMACTDADINDTVFTSGKADSVVTTVKTAICENKPFEYLIPVNGIVIAANKQEFFAVKEGVVKFCNAANGKWISAGEVIAIFDTETSLMKLKRAELQRYNAEKEYESQLLGYNSLLEERTDKVSESIKKKLRINSGLAITEQEIEEIMYDIGRATIVAPFDGVCVDVKCRAGQLVKAGDALLTLISGHDLFLEVRVLETDIALIKIGFKAQVRPISGGEKVFQATVAEINPHVDENGMVLVKLKLQVDTSGTLFSGMHCVINIRIPFKKSLVVPKEAVVIRNGKPVVFVMEAGKAKWNYVVVGRENGREIEVKEGLSPNQRVIISNNLQLAHDATVKE